MRGERFPAHGWIGLALTGVAWALNWSLDGARTHVLFFPLWLGYCLTVDAAVVRLRGESLLTRSRRRYVGLFVASMPAWWLFEVINWRTGNWIYLGGERLGDLEYFLLSSLSFSTVMPAVFGTAELLGGLSAIRRLPPGPRWRPRTTTMLVVGALMLALLLAWPRYFFPLVWLSVWFLVEPLNARADRRTLLDATGRGDWRPVLALALGALFCGLWWELWNYWSWPKWTYEIPFVDFGRVFEMPVLGYAGYLPFALELFALYHLLAAWVGAGDDGYLRPVARDARE